MSAIDAAHRLSPELIREAIEWRRHLHRHPEVAYNEHQTSGFIADQLGKFGFSVHRGLGGTGIVGTLRRGTSRRTIAIRADMDALPMEEQTGADYSSSNRGVMHACGHDGHVAMALAAACVSAGLSDLDGTVHFIFQPAEEGECGARRMIDDGLFRLFPCDVVYALHNQPALQFGSCVALDGVMLAASAVFEIEIVGRGCHGGRPHQGTDSILAACQLVSCVQSIASRNVDPLESCVVSVTQVHAGNAWSVIPNASVIRGTTRWFTDDVGDVIERRMTELARSIAIGFGCEARVKYDRRYPATINDPGVASFVRSVASTLPGVKLIDHPPTTGSEDFSEMLRVVPGCYVWLGSGKSNNDFGLHSPRYDFNDELLPLGAALWISLVEKSLCSS